MLMLSLLLFARAEAVTASIGNSRMVLNAAVGEVVERYILVKNPNDGVVRIEMRSSGDLEKTIKLRESNFSLQPGEEKKAYFTIKSNEVGTTENKILVQYTVEGEKNGVGLTSTVIFIVSEEGNADEEDVDENGGFFGFGGSDDNEEETNDESDSESSLGSTSGSRISPLVLLTISTLVLAIVFVILLIFYVKKTAKNVKVNGKKIMPSNKKIEKKRVGRARDK